MIPLRIQAIYTALEGDWTTAIKLNQTLIRQNPQDVESLNRLAFAYCVTGKFKEAKAAYQKVLTLDTINAIAQNGLKKLNSDTTKTSSMEQIQKQLRNIFLEETGKTRIIELVNIADVKTILHLQTGETVVLSIKRSKIFVLNEEKQYIGMLPDDLGKRIIKFLEGGNTYEAFIKCVENNRVDIFIRETKRSPKFKNQPSFILDKSHLVVKNPAINANSDKQKIKKLLEKEDQEDFSDESED